MHVFWSGIQNLFLIFLYHILASLLPLSSLFLLHLVTLQIDTAFL